MNRTLTGRGVALWLGGFFGVVLAANAWFVTLSLQSFHGEDRVRPYQQGLNYNAILAARARQQAEGWHATLSLDTAASPVRLRLAVTRPDGAPVEGLQLAGALRHPADTFRDLPIRLAAVGPGLYEAKIPDAAHGRRNAVIRAAGGIPFETERRIWLP
ncbi:MAG TPA: FixH family protein [Rhizomicrobium sp.]|nr:FixH family protein [Rhizomicrobium sp.]